MNIEQLLRSGALQGPYKRAKPETRWTAFVRCYRLYRRFHGRWYALRRAWHIEIQGADF